MGTSIEEMYQQITAEVHTHVPKLVATGILWKEARTWVDNQANLLYEQARKLTEQDRWPDDAGRQFLARVSRDVAVMRSWSDPTGMVYSMMTVGLPIPKNNATPDLSDSVYGLVDGLWQAHRAMEKLYHQYNALSEKDKNTQRPTVEAAMAGEINGLAPKYQAAALALRNAVGRDWEGPRTATSTRGRPGTTGPGTATAAPSASPAPVAPRSPDPGTQPEPTPTPADPVKDALEAAPGALDALSQALQSAQQLMGGGGGNVPSPIAPAGPGDLGSLTPGEVAARLSQLGGETSDGAGLPSLAGGGAEPIGAALGGGGAPVPAMTPGASSSPTGGGNLALPAVASVATGSSAGASAATSPGAMPPAQQAQQGNGARTTNGIKPGAAEHAATGRSRDRKPAGTPGVSLPGRSGRGRPVKRGAPEPAPAGRRWDGENDTVQLLDEELWQVKQETTAPRHRAGH